MLNEFTRKFTDVWAFRGWNAGRMMEIMHRWRQEEVKQEKRRDGVGSQRQKQANS